MLPRAPRRAPGPALTADPLRGVQALRLLQEAAGLFGLVGFDGGQRNTNAPLRLVPVRLHGGGGRAGGRRGGAGRGRMTSRSPALRRAGLAEALGAGGAAVPWRGQAGFRRRARAGGPQPVPNTGGDVRGHPGILLPEGFRNGRVIK